MSNKYTPDGKFIIDATGKQWPVDSPHPLPLPGGIRDHSFIYFSGTYTELWSSVCMSMDTHWLARSPLPPVPKPKTQDERDEDAAKSWADEYAENSPGFKWLACDVWNAFKAGAAYARKEAK